MRRIFAATISLLILSAFSFTQTNKPRKISQAKLIEILKAEDELRFDKVLKAFMRASNPELRKRAALAAGRIGDEDAIPLLSDILRDNNSDVQQMAAFAIGEIESVKGANAILGVLISKQSHARARAIEAAGKIVAANREAASSKTLSKVILGNLKYEARRRSRPDEDVILLGLTAALRAKPFGADSVVAKFLGYSNWRIRADALNTLARLRAKNANDKTRELLKNDEHPVVRANAARLLGAAGDKSSVDLILNSAISDKDLRVRINAIRALSGLREIKSADVLLKRAEKLFGSYEKSDAKNPVEINEILTIISALGNILKANENPRAIKFLERFRERDRVRSSETELAFARISPRIYLDSGFPDIAGSGPDRHFYSNISGALGEILKLPDENNAKMRDKAFFGLIRLADGIDSPRDGEMSLPSYLRAISNAKMERVSISSDQFSQADVQGFMAGAFRDLLMSNESGNDEDKFENFILVRAAAASLLGNRKASPENISVLKKAFEEALKTDVRYDDAQLAILSAIVKLDKSAAIETLNVALDYHAFLVRRTAANLIKANGLEKDFPNLKKRVGTVRKYNPKNGSKLGQVLNTRTDYKRAQSRKNGKSKAILATEKGEFTIQFFPEQAPLTVDNFIKLANSGYFNGVDIHRVVPNFVMQDGDPRGDGNGGPGWQIRCEINQIQYSRGMVGMALSGKDTGGSQWFVTHSPQPHLDGGYTIFGKVNENDMKIVDNLVRGDKILSVKIVE